MVCEFGGVGGSEEPPLPSACTPTYTYTVEHACRSSRKIVLHPEIRRKFKD